MSSKPRIVYAGTPEFAATALKALIDAGYPIAAVYTQPDRPAGRGRKLKASAVKELALAHNLEVHQPLSLKGEAEQAELAALNADVMVVAAYGLILPKAVLETPALGCLNIHGSLLPRWRGAAPIQRAILAGDAETGITIMQMDVGLDTGDMLYKVSTPIASTDTAQTLHDRLADLGAEAIVTALEKLVAGELTAEKQNDDEANYASKLEKSEALIDWQEPADVIDRRIRAFNPWPVCQTPWGEQMVRIWAATPLADAVAASPGCVVGADKNGIDIATGEGRLRVTKLQMPGKKPMDVAAFLNAHDVTGVCFGNG